MMAPNIITLGIHKNSRLWDFQRAFSIRNAVHLKLFICRYSFFARYKKMYLLFFCRTPSFCVIIFQRKFVLSDFRYMVSRAVRSTFPFYWTKGKCNIILGLQESKVASYSTSSHPHIAFPRSNTNQIRTSRKLHYFQTVVKQFSFTSQFSIK